LPEKSRNIDAPDKRFPEDWVNKVHIDGMIFGGALWDMRASLGAAYANELALRAMRLPALDFDTYLGVLLEEDDDPTFSPDPAANNDVTDGTPNAPAICHAFYDRHGIYDPSCAGQTTGPVARITDPSPIGSYNASGGASASVPITGSADGSAASPLQGFILEWAEIDDLGTWSQTGFSLTGDGAAPVSDGALGVLDTSAMASGVYAIRLTVSALNGTTATATTSIIVDDALLDGWPQATNIYNFLNDPVLFLASPAVADLYPQIPGLEVVAVTWGKPGLHVWQSDGTSLWYMGGAFGIASPAVGDLDGDGDLEIVVHGYDGKVWAYHHDGVEMGGIWPQASQGAAQWSTPALADLDGDGTLEIVVGSTDGNLYGWDHAGNPLQGWPVPIGGQIRSSAALGDLDSNGSVEVVIDSPDGTVHVLTSGGGPFDAGTPDPEWPKTLAGPVPKSGSPVLGDLDGDGDLEILLAAGNAASFQIHAWHHNGAEASGWPVAIPSAELQSPSELVLSDLDGDNQPEVLARTRDGRLHAWQGDGMPVTGWPPNSPETNINAEESTSPVVADLNGNGGADVVADSGSAVINGHVRYDVEAFQASGVPVAGWPRFVPNDANSTPAIADVDQDGDTDVLVGSHGMFIWSLAGTFTAAAAEWPFYRHDVQRTGTYGGDGVAPLIALNGPLQATIEACAPYPLPKATAWDDVDGDLSDAVVVDFSQLDTQVPGTYAVSYDVSDSAGNAAETVVHTVEVVDTTPPVIVLLGPPEATIPVGGSYADAGAIAKDCVDGEIAVLNAGSDLDVNTPGTYEFVYFGVSDSAGNVSAPASRVVIVSPD